MKKTKRERIQREIKDLFLVLSGCFLLALSDALFIIPNHIVNGGVDSIGVLINFYFQDRLGFDLSDIVVAVVQILLWVLGLFFLGKKFSAHTLLGTLAFPAFYSLLLRTNVYEAWGLKAFFEAHSDSVGSLALAGLFGGGIAGIGVALTYLGDGSTGGTDILCFIIEKYARVTQDLSGMALDAIFILTSLFCMRDWGLTMSGILSSLACAVAVRLLYVKANDSVVCHVITEQFELVNGFIQNRLGHGTTVIEGSSGRSGKERKIVRAVMYRDEADDLKSYIAMVDPDAFFTIAALDETTGRGFSPWRSNAWNRKRLLRKYGVEIKERKNPDAEFEDLDQNQLNS